MHLLMLKANFWQINQHMRTHFKPIIIFNYRYKYSHFGLRLQISHERYFFHNWVSEAVFPSREESPEDTAVSPPELPTHIAMGQAHEVKSRWEHCYFSGIQGLICLGFSLNVFLLPPALLMTISLSYPREDERKGQETGKEMNIQSILWYFFFGTFRKKKTKTKT